MKQIKFTDFSGNKAKTILIPEAIITSIAVTEELDLSESKKAGKKVFVPTMIIETEKPINGNNITTSYLKFPNDETLENEIKLIEKQMTVYEINNEWVLR